MAISKVRVQIDGVWTNLTKSNGKWTGTITAPSTTSYNLANKYYPVKVEVTNDAGTVVTKDATDATLGEALRLIVKETMKPIITLVSPSSDAYVTNNQQPITFKVVDETGGSGVNLSTVKIKVDGTTYTASSEGMQSTGITNGYQFVFTPQSALSDGKHTISISASDNDGNAATGVSTSFSIDTVPPTLTISYPQSGLITNKSSLTLSGNTNDATSSPITLSMSLNGTSIDDIPVEADGSFSKGITLKEGTNSIVVNARDGAGQSTTITLSVKLDTSVPVLSGITLAPNPVSTSASVAITVEVS